MKVLIQETNERKELALIDPETGINHVLELIGSWDGLSQFQWNEVKGVYVCHQVTYTRWQNVIEMHQKLVEKITALRRQYGYDAVATALEAVRSYPDPAVYLKEMLEALKKAFQD